MHLSLRSLPIKVLLLSTCVLAVALFFVGTTAHAQSCGATWSTPFTIETNPFTPGTGGYDAWRSVYGTSRVVYSSFQVAGVGDGTCNGEGTTPTASLLAVPSTIGSGEQSSLSWGSQYATSCTGTGFSTGGAPAGTVLVSPTATTNYSVSCTDGLQTASASATVTVTGVRVTLSANPGSVESGSASTLAWQATGAQVCVGNGFETQGATSGTVSTGPLSASTNYSVTCTGEAATPVLGTWQLSSTDTSDLSCPITSLDRVYGSVATCPASPQGKTCSGTGSGSVCKINQARSTQEGGGGCFIDTSIYVCQGGSAGVPPPSATAYATVAVTQASAANLTAGAITPTTATTGAVVTLSSLITNTGTLLTPLGFTNLFQIDNNADHSAVTATKTDTSPALAPSTGDTSQVSYTFGTPGTWYVRACADNNGSWVGAITESNEADNCGPWTQVNVTNACTGSGCLPDGSTLSCSASPTTLTAGGSTTWTASPSGLGTYTWTPSETGTPISGTQTLTRSYATAGNYTMSVRASGVTVPCANTVTVGSPSCGVAAPSISASPTRVQTGGTAELRISATGVDGSCTVTGVAQPFTASGCTIGAVAPFRTGAINTLTKYTISCDDGEASADVLVNVVPKIQEF